MITVKTRPESPGVLCLGKRGENLARKIVIDCSRWRQEYGDGALTLLLRRPGSSGVYPAVTELDGEGNTVWAVTSADTAAAGVGRCEMQYSVGDTLVKSAVRETSVEASLDGEVIDPDQESSILDQITKLIGRATLAVAEALAASDAASRSAAEATEAVGQVRADLERLADVEAGAQVNVIEIVAANGADLTPDAAKRVNVPVPTRLSQLTNDSAFQTKAQVDAAIEAAIAENMPEVYAGPYTAEAMADADTALQTAGKRMEQDVTVKKISVAEVTNQSGGYTVTIGG